MPKNYSLDVTPANEQRRPKNAMSDEWVKDFLRRAAIGHVATRWDDQPFITPTSFWYDEAQHAIIFHSNLVGRIRANSQNGMIKCASRPANTANSSPRMWRWNSPCSIRASSCLARFA